MLEEKVFFDNGNIKVTNSRFIVHGQTYVISNIASIKMLKYENMFQRLLYFIVIFLGVVGVGIKSKDSVVGNYFIGASIILFILTTRLKPSYFVSIVSSSGIFAAVKSTNKELITEIIDALNKAIIDRG